jgi:hypothetical protein
MAGKQKPWILRQWSDIKGNAKFALLIAVGALMIDWIRNGSAWQVFGTTAVFLIGLGCFILGSSRTFKRIGWGCSIAAIIMSVYGITTQEINRSQWQAKHSASYSSSINDSPYSINIIGQSNGTNMLTVINTELQPVIFRTKANVLNVPTNSVYFTSLEVSVANCTRRIGVFVNAPAGIITNRCRVLSKIGSLVDVGGSHYSNVQIIGFDFITSERVKESDFKFFLKP